MKNWKTASILGAALLALGGLATWDEWQTKKDEKEKETAQRLVQVKPEQVVGLVFYTSGDSDTGGDKAPPVKEKSSNKEVSVSLKLQDGKWTITSPVTELADQQTVQDLIKNIAEYKYEKDVTNDKSQWSQYGLDKPRRRLEIELSDGSKTTVFVGNNAPVGYSVYAASDKSDTVYTGSQYVATSLAKTLFDFRDKKLFAISTPDINTVTSKQPGSKPLQIERKDGKWMITSPESTEADLAQTNNFLDDVVGLKIAEFTDQPTKEQRDAFAASKLALELSLTDAKGNTQTLKVAKIKDAIYAAFNPETRVLKLSEDAKTKLFKTVNDLRNKKIFSFQSAQVESVDVDSKVFVRVKDEWYTKDDAAKFNKDGKFAGKESEKPATKSNIRGLLVDLEYAKAEAVFGSDSDIAKKLPAAPKNKIKLSFSGEGKQPLEIDVWQAGDNPEQIYVRSAGSAKLYKAKKSIIASASDAVTLPAEDAQFPVQPAEAAPPTP